MNRSPGSMNDDRLSTTGPARQLEGAEFVAPASEAPAVAAAAPQNESLYESLLRYHEEHDDDEEDGDKKKAPLKTVYDDDGDDNVDDRKPPANLKSADSFEDRKPPAKPAAALNHPPTKKSPPAHNSSTDTKTPMLPTSFRPPPHSSFPIPPNDSDEPRIRLFSAAAGNRGSFYQAALEESRMMEGTGNASPPNRNLTKPGATKPGAVMVNEAVALPHSTMYRQAYGEPPRAQNRNTGASNFERHTGASNFKEPMGVDETCAMIAALAQTKKVAKQAMEEDFDSIFPEDLDVQSRSESPEQAGKRKSPGEVVDKNSPGPIDAICNPVSDFYGEDASSIMATNLSGHGPSNLSGQKPSRGGPEPNYSTGVRNPRGRSPGRARHSVSGQDYDNKRPSSKLPTTQPLKNKSMDCSRSRSPLTQGFDDSGRVNSGFDVMKDIMKRSSLSPSRNPDGRGSRQKATASKSPSPHKNRFSRGFEALTGRSISPNSRQSTAVDKPSNSKFGGFFGKGHSKSKSPVRHSAPSDAKFFGEGHSKSKSPARHSTPSDRHLGLPDRHHRLFGRPKSPPPPSNSHPPATAARTADEDPDMDEDLLLALELSKKDTGQPSSQVSDDTRYASGLPASSPPSKRSNYAMNDPNHGSIQDLLFALDMSEETYRGESNKNTYERSSHIRRMSTSLTELLALESSGRTGMDKSEERLVTDFVAAGISTDKTSRPDEQFRILEQIREEQEQKELELALKESQEEPALPAINMKEQAQDFLTSQHKAMEEWSKNTAKAGGGDQDDDDRKQPAVATGTSLASQDSTDRRRELVERGTAETQEAITSGQAHIVTCRGCKGRLQAPVSYSLVFCPKCQTISPA